MSKSRPKLYDFVRLPLLLFSVAGIPIFKWNPEDKLNILQIIALLVALLNVSYNLVGKFAFLFFGEIKDHKELTLLIAYWVLVFNCLIKMCGVWSGRNKLKEVFMQMKESFPCTKDLESEYKVADYYKKLQRYHYNLIIINVATVQAFNFLPLTQSLIEYFFSTEEQRTFEFRFPYMLYYNFDTTQPKNYIFAYFVQCLGATTMEFYYLGSDLLLMTSVHLQIMHFEYLAKRIENLLPTGTDDDLEELNELMKYHKDVMM